ncbi:hypothetical protein HIMB5_00011780 [alpha proteobacterium HIMB5]|nr:hypothetical protein HIMB5_00011780 [alpha proteobacterium HIMB5]
MKQQIKCPHCNKVFPIEESIKHEAEEFRKKLQKEEEQKSKERQKLIEDKFNQRLAKEQQAHEKLIEKVKSEAEKKQKAEVEKQSAAEVEKIKKQANEYYKKQKQELEAKAKQDQEKERLKKEAELAEIKRAHQIDIDRMRKKAEEAARAASQSPVERKGEVREELLEEYLSNEFPKDKFKEVKKGQRGADVIQTVMVNGEAMGNILHESKDVLNFDEKWVAKLLDDMTKVDATVGFIFTKVMPKKSKGFVEEREGGRVIICSEYPILKQLVSTTRKLIQSERKANDKSEDQISTKLKDLLKYLNSNEFRIQTRKILNGIKSDSDQIDKDQRSFENQIKNRKKNLDESKKNINGIITSLVSSAGLSEEILDINDDDFLIEE